MAAAAGPRSPDQPAAADEDDRPAVSVPAGRSGGGLPIGMSVEALQGEDTALLALAQRVQEVLRGSR